MRRIIISSLLFFFLFLDVLASTTNVQTIRSNQASSKYNGRIELRVWDREAKKYIYAGLGIYPSKPQRNKFYSKSTATVDDGAAHTLILPSGTYLAKIERYLCDGKVYFAAARPPTFRLSVKAGRLSRKILRVDVSKIRAKPSYDNPDGKACSK